MFGLIVGFGVFLYKSSVLGLADAEAIRAAAGFWWNWFVFWAVVDALMVLVPLVGGGVFLAWISRLVPPPFRPLLGLFGTGLGAGVLTWLFSRENMLRLAGTVTLLWGAHSLLELSDRAIAGADVRQGAFAVEFLVMFIGLIVKRRASRRLITTVQMGGAPFGAGDARLAGLRTDSHPRGREEIEVEAEVMETRKKGD